MDFAFDIVWKSFLHHCMSQNEGNRFAKYLMKPCDDFTIWFCQERPRLRSAPPFPCGLTPLTVWVLPSTRKWRKLQIFAARHDYVVLQIWWCGSLSRDQPRSWQRLRFSRGIVSLCVGLMILQRGNNRTWRNEELILISYSLNELLHDRHCCVSYDSIFVSLYL